MYWKKTEFEMNEARKNRDLTGGYDYFPWILKFRKFIILVSVGSLIFGINSLNLYLKDSKEYVSLGASILFGIIVPTVVIILSVKEFKNKKNGLSQ